MGTEMKGGDKWSIGKEETRIQRCLEVRSNEGERGGVEFDEMSIGRAGHIVVAIQTGAWFGHRVPRNGRMLVPEGSMMIQKRGKGELILRNGKVMMAGVFKVAEREPRSTGVSA